MKRLIAFIALALISHIALADVTGLVAPPGGSGGGASLPTCNASQILYYATTGNAGSCLALGTNLSIASGILSSIVPVNTASSAISVTPNCTYSLVKVTASTYEIAAPTGLTATDQTTGGSLASSTTYYFQVVGVTAAGTTTASIQASATTSAGTTDSIALGWASETGAASYDIWYSTSSSMTSPKYYTSATNSFTLTADAGTAGTIPTSNTSGQFTLNAPGTCTPVDGQRLEIKVISPSGGIVTYNWNATYLSSGQLALPTTSYAAGKEDYFIAQYDADKSGWALLSYNQGF